MHAACRALPVLLAVVAACTSAEPVGTPTAPPASSAPTAAPVSPPASAEPLPSSEPTASAEPIPTTGPSPTASASTSPSPAPSPSPSRPGIAELVGIDGRLSVLVLGSDARPGLGGNRTDAIMVVTVDPATGRVAGVSLPRDTVNVPVGPGREYGPKITGLYQHYVGTQGGPEAAAEKMKASLGYAFDVEIDRYAVVGFDALTRLVEALGGIDVVLERSLNDPSYRLPDGRRGIHFRAGRNHLDGTMALAFARTRKADSDYHRSYRQQQVIIATARAIRERGLAVLPAVLRIAGRFVQTDLPPGLAPELLTLLAEARLDRAKRFVLSPRRYAGPGPERYSIELKIDRVRALFDLHFAAVAPG